MEQIQYQPYDPNAENYQPEYSFIEPSPVKRRVPVWLWILIGLICLAGIAAVLVFVVFGHSNAPAISPVPLLLLDGSEVTLIRDGETISLGQAAQMKDKWGTYLNATITTGRNLMFYLADVDKDTGEGTLMKVAAAGSGAPEKIAENVCTAVISEDGNRVLYVTDVDIVGGDLMLAENGHAKRVARDVVPEQIGFSRNGEYFSFLQVDKTAEGYAFTVYAGRSAEDIESVDEFDTENYRDYLYLSNVMDNGTLVYSLRIYNTDSDDEAELSMCEYGGSPEKIADKGFPQWRYGDAFLYTDESELYYMEEGEKPERILGDFSHITSLYDENGRISGSSMLLYQEGDSEDTVTVYSYEMGQDAEEICEADEYSVIISHGNKYVSYLQDGELFLNVKSKDGWDSISMETKALNFGFDDSERYFYFITIDGEEDIKGDLYRYDAATDDKKRLQKDIAKLEIIGDDVYTIDDEGRAYYIAPDGKDKLVAEDAQDLYEGSGGVYILQKDGSKSALLFLPLGSSHADKIVNSFDEVIGLWWDIDYQMPIPSDVKQALDEMRQDALIVFDAINDTKLAETDILHRTYEESKDLAGELKDRADVSSEVQNILWDFYFGFWDIQLAMDAINLEMYSDAQENIDRMNDELGRAVSAYEDYIAQNS